MIYDTLWHADDNDHVACRWQPCRSLYYYYLMHFFYPGTHLNIPLG